MDRAKFAALMPVQNPVMQRRGLFGLLAGALLASGLVGLPAAEARKHGGRNGNGNGRGRGGRGGRNGNGKGNGRNNRNGNGRGGRNNH